MNVSPEPLMWMIYAFPSSEQASWCKRNVKPYTSADTLGSILQVCLDEKQPTVKKKKKKLSILLFRIIWCHNLHVLLTGKLISIDGTSSEIPTWNGEHLVQF